MERLFSLIGKRALVVAGIALVAPAAPRVAMAQTVAPAAQTAAPEAQPDALKFTTSTPTILGWQVKADKTKDFEDFWSGLRAMIAKSESADLKAFGETLSKIYRVNVPPFDNAGNQVVIYLFQLDSPSTTLSYNPVSVLYTDPNGLRAGLEGSKVTRPEADALYEKVKTAVVGISPIWPLIKVG